MTAKVRAARGGKGWEYDVRFRWPEGGRFRERANAPVSNKSAALRWAEARERSLLSAGKAAYVQSKAPPAAVKPHGTLADFWPRFVEGHYRANRKKPSTIDAAESLFRLHIKPPLGALPRHEIGRTEIAALKGALATKSVKTTNNTLSVLSRCLRTALEWGELAAMPCKIGLLKVARGLPVWYERHDYRRLVAAAAELDARIHILVLLAGSAGLRRGEITALKFTDLDLPRRQIHVQRAFWRKHEDTPKGGRGRTVPMTPELADALARHRHTTGERILYSDLGRQLSNRTVRNWLAQAQRRAALSANGAIHMLRHTFCSHLAAAGAPAKAIQEIAGHQDLSTTQRYMHLSPSDRSAAMGALVAYHAGACEDAKARSA